MTPLSTQAFVLTMTFMWVAVVAPSPADGATKFDGSWTFDFVTASGACDRHYRLTGGEVINGSFVHPVASNTNFSGRVAPSGAVTAAVSIGPYFASASGRLSTVSGGGTWRGVGPEGPCSGTWSGRRD